MMLRRLITRSVVCMALAGFAPAIIAQSTMVPANATTFPVPAPDPFHAAGSTTSPTVAPSPATAVAVSVTAPAIRLYALDCGTLHLPDMGMFSDTGEYDGRSGTLVSPCFVVMHPSGTLLWDTGLGDKLAGKGAVTVDGGVIMQVDRSLQSQLQAIGVRNIDYLGFSHLHFDHTGNAGAFPNATWLVARQDLDAALGGPDPFINPDDISTHKRTKKQLLDGDHDVFGDGSVKILKAPGHTAGHQVLLVRLAKSGPVILSGDLYHTRENRHYQRVPTFNDSRADTLASMNRIETLASNLGARIIIQHDPEEFSALPQMPGHLE
ncbi:MAG: MBL fold metallo-hydrolase [Burkholderiaceae bacterium]